MYQIIDKPVRVIATPGSGKTESIANKFLTLVKEGVFQIEEILVLTFSNKATEELINRIESKLIKENIKYNFEQLNIKTIHGFCSDILSKNSSELTNDFSTTLILDEISQGSFILSFIEDFGFRSKIEAADKVFNRFIPYFNKISDENLNPDDVYKFLINKFDKNLKAYRLGRVDDKSFDKEFNNIKELIYLNSLYPIYKNKLVEKKFTDFSHLQSFLFKELNSNSKLVNRIKDSYKYILVDEFQDTSYLQWQILKILVNKNNITICGDDDQALYRFRGATVNNFLGLQNDFKVKLVDETLNINYRSDKSIIEYSQKLIQKNKKYRSTDKNVAAKSINQGLFTFSAFEDTEQEAESIVQIIYNLKKSNLITNYSDITILFRSVLNESPIYINKLSEHNIPFKVIGVDKIETSAILFSVVDLWKFCSGYTAKLEISNTLIKMSRKDTDLFIQCENSPELFLKKADPSSKCKIEFEKLYEIKRKLKDKEYRSNLGFAYDLLDTFKVIYENFNINNETNLNDLSFLLKIVSDFDLSYQRTDPYLLSKIFNLLTLKGETSEITTKGDFVNIMTVHQSKGLEFPYIIMPYQITKKKRSNSLELLNPILHYESSDQNIIDEIDERKVQYVAITRAKYGVFLTAPDKIQYGKTYRKTKYNSLISDLEINNTPISDVFKLINNYKTINYAKLKIEHNLLNLNFSAIQTYLICPRKYEIKYEYKFPTVLEGPMLFGSSLHKIIDNVHKNYLKSSKINYTTTELEKIVNDNWIEISYKKKEAKEMKQLAIQYVFNYINRFASDFHKILASEKKFSIENKKNNYRFNGVWDLIFKTDDKLEIIDFKTSDIENEFYEIQMNLYSATAKNIYGTKDLPMTKLYSFKTGEVKIIDPSKNKKINLNTYLDDIAIKISTKQFKPNIGKHCNQCSFKKFCY
jgi:DNA helicase-2/ATP-dependent DNA helicase PcrA